MSDGVMQRWSVLARRELLEYRNSLVFTPALIAVALAFFMLLSVTLADRISAMGNAIMEVILEEHASVLDIRVEVDEKGSTVRHDYRIKHSQDPVDESEWDFEREWEFEPGASGSQSSPQEPKSSLEDDSLNLMLNLVHMCFLLVLLLVSAHYLLNSLFVDRRDGSILFWKSMPVPDRDEVLAKFCVALAVAPAIYITASVAAQWVSSLLAMLLVWRMDRDPVELILENIEFGSLLFNQMSGWMLTALWLAPIYAWLLLASAAARRSPFMVAVGPVIALVVVERIVFGTRYVGNAVSQHLPHANGESAVGFYLNGPDWASQDLASIALGLVFTAVALWGAVYLRSRRFDA